MIHTDIFRKYRSINVLGSSSIWTCRILNSEFGIFVVWFRQVQWKKSKQIFEIRHVHIDELPRTKDRNTPSEIFSSHCVLDSHFTDHAARNSATYITNIPYSLSNKV